MYISQINIQNFRNFKGNNFFEFNEGLNVIIGHNNSGKSNLLKALDLVLNFGSSKRLSVDDFNKDISIEELKKQSPKISISVTFTESEWEAEYSEDLVTVSSWLVKLKSPYQAQLTYVFYLPEKDEEDYRKAMANLESDDIEDYWREIQYNFLRKYKYNIYGGRPELKQTADPEALKKIDFQFLDAVRDVERDLFSGKNTLLREVLDFFMDYDIKSDTSKLKEKQKEEINQRKKQFSSLAHELIKLLQARMEQGKKEMLRYVNNTGASFGNTEPDFDGHILDSELYSALRLIVRHETGITIPATHNGLGYNNLIYISLLLAKMQRDASGDYLGSNAKVFPVLSIEEPEAHLHPAMQYKFLKFLKENSKEKVRQIFITTHSPNITAAVGLDQIICLHRKEENSLNVAYLGKAFGDNKESKAYVERFLDVTKSDVLFAKGVILVEGIAEQLTIPVFARYAGFDLESNHISVINVGGRYFKHFLKLFDSSKPNTIHKEVACITDLDPLRREKYDVNSKFEKCYPFELNLENDQYEYQSCSNDMLNEQLPNNIKFFTQQVGVGKTFEYELAYSNPSCKLLITKSASNLKELEKLMELYQNDENLDEIIKIVSKKGKESPRIIESIKKYSGQDSREHLIAARYLNSVDKGENAYELSKVLEENLTGSSHLISDYDPKQCFLFKVPKYIKDAISWICS